MRHSTLLAGIASLGCAAWAISPASAVTIGSLVGATYSSSRDAAEPASGTAADTCWKFEGVSNNGYTGTAIAPHAFVTAAHVGTGSAFTFAGVTYNVVRSINDPSSDLTIGIIDGTLPTYAPLYTQTNEVNRPMYVFGHAGAPGAGVKLGSTLKGWLETTPNGNAPDLSWGSNTVAGTQTIAGKGDLLLFSFSPSHSSPAAAMAGGDSGGGVFIQDPTDNQWKLAGVNYVADRLYSMSADGSNPFYATIVNRSGLYESDGAGGWVAVSGPALSGATRISQHIDWITQTENVPEPGSLALLALGSLALIRRHRR